MRLEEVKSLCDKIKGNISKVIVGNDDTIDMILTTLLCSGHILLEDVPGVGKTTLAKCLAKSISSDFKRIQFTPDLLPSDLTGVNYYNQKTGDFVFRAGPIFANIILADEINRATPRTQSSLLECMEEKQVTIDGVTHLLSRPFLVIATQNPIEIHGTFPLPEAQMDRFFMRLRMGHPNTEESRRILDRFQSVSSAPEIDSVADSSEIIEAQEVCLSVKIVDDVKDYIVTITENTRKHEKVSLGVSPRGSIALMKAAQAYAVLQNRDYVLPDDVKKTAVPVLAHRLVLKGHAVAGGTDAQENIINEILKETPVPLEIF